jgi:hypothetical protein
MYELPKGYVASITFGRQLGNNFGGWVLKVLFDSANKNLLSEQLYAAVLNLAHSVLEIESADALPARCVRLEELYRLIVSDPRKPGPPLTLVEYLSEYPDFQFAQTLKALTTPEVDTAPPESPSAAEVANAIACIYANCVSAQILWATLLRFVNTLRLHSEVEAHRFAITNAWEAFQHNLTFLVDAFAAVIGDGGSGPIDLALLCCKNPFEGLSLMEEQE